MDDEPPGTADPDRHGRPGPVHLYGTVPGRRGLCRHRVDGGRGTQCATQAPCASNARRQAVGDLQPPLGAVRYPAHHSADVAAAAGLCPGCAPRGTGEALPMSARQGLPGRVLVFARAPVAGATKTRLIPVLGAGPAAELSAQLLHRTLEAAGDYPLELWCTPTPEHEVFVRCRQRYGVTLHVQR